MTATRELQQIKQELKEVLERIEILEKIIKGKS